MLRCLILLCCSLFLNLGNAQLTFSRLDKSVEIPLGAYLELKSCRNNSDGSGCTFFKTRGALLSSNDIELEINATNLSLFGAGSEKDMSRYFIVKNKTFIPVDIPKNQISLIKMYKSKKSFKSYQNRKRFSGVLILTGAVTALNMLVVNMDSRKGLGISAGIQIGGAILLGVIGSPKKYDFSPEEEWQIQ